MPSKPRFREKKLLNLPTHPITALSGTLNFPITDPASKPTDGSWVPSVKVSGKGAEAGEVIVGNGTSVAVPIAKIRHVLTRRSGASGFGEYEFDVRGGATVTQGKDKVDSFKSERISTKIVSLAEPGITGAIAVGVDQVKVERGKSDWIPAKGKLNVAGAPFVIALSNPADFERIVPVIAGANKVGVTTVTKPGANGIFVVRSGQVIAQLFGSGVNVAGAKALRMLLDGDIVFKGPKNSYKDPKAHGDRKLSEVINELLNKGQIVYIQRKTKVFPVSREFVKTSDEVGKFIDQQADAVFMDKVEILDSK